MLQATVRGVDLYGSNTHGVDLYGHLGGVDLYGQRSSMGPRGLAGLGATGNADVKDLQTALKAWAATGHPTADPGDVDGIVGPKTRAATIAVVSQLPKLPDDVRIAIQAAGAAANFSSQATQVLDQTITSYAKQIATAIRAIMIIDPQQTLAPALHYRVAVLPTSAASTPASTVSSWFSIPPGKTWYQTTWGKGSIGVGALAVGVGVVLLVL